MHASRESHARRRTAVWWAVAALWWTVDGLVAASNYHRMGRLPEGLTWAAVFRTTMTSAWMWVPLTVLAFWLADRFPLERGAWRRHLPAHAAGALVACVARAGAVALLNPWVGWYATLPSPRALLLTSLTNNVLLFWMLVGVGHALAFARRYRDRDERLVRAELHSLKMQLHPHFLFNTLNTVSAYVRADPDAAERMIARLSQLLRHALERTGTQEVSLDEELRAARTYLDIEQVRFQDRLSVRWDIAPEARPARVPHLILQPLVENAIRHGIAPRAAAGTIQIAAERRDGTLHLAVRDDGVGLRGAPVDGVGLTNTRDRLRQLYGARHRFQVADAPDGGVHVELTLPFRTEHS
jgi:two-component sensor histidine kinase